MSEYEYRYTELRFEEDTTRQSPGRLVGTLVTYGERAADRPEAFAPGSLQFDAGGVVVNRQHQRGQPVVRVHPRTEGNKVIIDAPLLDTTAGRDVATEMRSDPPLLTGLSVAFKPLKESRRNGLRWIERARVGFIGLVDAPAYAGSTAEIRERDTNARRAREEELLRWL